jgi:hypothetical protein
MAVALPVLAGALLVCADSALGAGCHEHSYAVYLSPRFQSGVRWGGYHVTLVGFSANHACSGGMTKVLQSAWRQVQGGKPYSFKSKTQGRDYEAHRFQYPWGQQWGIAFKSGVLTRKLLPLLRKGGFENLKSHWHVSLYADSAKAAIAKFDGSLKGVPWRLFLVRLPDKLCQDKGKGCRQSDWTEVK